MDVGFSDTHFPEWWNINTHRCNHLNRLAVQHENYGFGRALVGDWGRVGAINVTPSANDIEVFFIL